MQGKKKGAGQYQLQLGHLPAEHMHARLPRLRTFELLQTLHSLIRIMWSGTVYGIVYDMYSIVRTDKSLHE